MTANICIRLLNKVWRFYEVDQIPHIEGIYVIGENNPFDNQTEVLYVGRSKDVHRRMLEHKRQRLAIDQYVREQFHDNDGEDLRVKWIVERNDEKTEQEYIECIARKLGYWPKYNIR